MGAMSEDADEEEMKTANHITGSGRELTDSLDSSSKMDASASRAPTRRVRHTYIPT